jgi:uncharacterized protein
MLIKAGVLSDTHLTQPDNRFKRLVEQCFHACDVIIHAGDITEPSVLEMLNKRPLYVVHGNMCNNEIRACYPEELLFTLNRFTIGLTHGAQLGHDIETALWKLFPEADCMIFGHTHRPVCHYHGTTLFLNPGSFQATGRYGAPGTFAILEAGDELRGRLYEIPQTP